MKQIRIIIVGMTQTINVPEEDAGREPIIMKIELIELDTGRILSRGVRVLEVHGDHLVIV